MQPEFLNSPPIRRCGSLKFPTRERREVYENDVDFRFSGVDPRAPLPVIARCQTRICNQNRFSESVTMTLRIVIIDSVLPIPLAKSLIDKRKAGLFTGAQWSPALSQWCPPPGVLPATQMCWDRALLSTRSKIGREQWPQSLQPAFVSPFSLHSRCRCVVCLAFSSSVSEPRCLSRATHLTAADSCTHWLS